MRLTDEQLAAIAATEGWHWDQPRAMARELLTARRVVEAAANHFQLLDMPGPKVTHATETTLRRRLAEYAALTAHDAAAKEKP